MIHVLSLKFCCSWIRTLCWPKHSSEWSRIFCVVLVTQHVSEARLAQNKDWWFVLSCPLYNQVGVSQPAFAQGSHHLETFSNLYCMTSGSDPVWTGPKRDLQTEMLAELQTFVEMLLFCYQPWNLLSFSHQNQLFDCPTSGGADSAF